MYRLTPFLHFILDTGRWLQRRFDRSSRGAGLVEYALLVALIAIACLASLEALGGSNGGSIDGSSSSIGSAVGYTG